MHTSHVLPCRLCGGLQAHQPTLITLSGAFTWKGCCCDELIEKGDSVVAHHLFHDLLQTELIWHVSLLFTLCTQHHVSDGKKGSAHLQDLASCSMSRLGRGLKEHTNSR